MSFILPVNIGVGDGGDVPQKIRERNIFAANYYVKFGHFSGKNRIRFRNIVTLPGK